VPSGEALCLVLRADSRVDRTKLAAALGITAKAAKRGLALASSRDCVDVWGYPPGSMPPFAHRTPIRTIIDSALMIGDEDQSEGDSNGGDQEDLGGDLGAGASRRWCRSWRLVVGGGGPSSVVELSPRSLLRLCR
jgi:prolyl-tRNA editing enzyme YbaK/EbsC (Cys-tRNA(Pro) deacylase)